MDIGFLEVVAIIPYVAEINMKNQVPFKLRGGLVKL
jgi:hypothetical protein